MSTVLPESLSKLVADLQDRGFVIAHRALDQVSEDEAAVWLELSDGLAAGGRVLLVRLSGEWEVVIEVGDRSFWRTQSVWQAMREQVSVEQPRIGQTHEDLRQLTLEVVDRLHGDPAARRRVVQTARRWQQREPRD